MAHTLLVTGSAGFIGSHLLRLLLKETDYHIISLDCLSYASDTDTIADLIKHPRHQFVHGNICNAALVDTLVEQADGIIHMAAESHVDRSILSATPFIETNVLGTQVLLDAASQHNISRFLYVSTDEVYGDLGDSGSFDETRPLAPSSPYAASKAAADLMVQAWHRTYGLPTIVTRCTNNLGTHQHPEKLIPRLCLKALHHQPLPIYGSGQQVRDWIDVRDHVRALHWAYEEAPSGFVVNIGAKQEISNIQLAQKILQLIPESTSQISHIRDRLGHDFRYANNTSKLQNHSQWRPKHSLDESLSHIVNWYRNSPEWWTPRWNEQS